LKQIIFDGNFMAHRARHTTGRLRNGISFGMLKSMNTVCKRFESNNIVWVFDGGISPTRREMMPEYKTGRGTVDGLFSTQVKHANKAIKALGGKILRYTGVEADDIIAIIAKSSKEDTIIVSSDKDFLQLIDENISVFNPIKNELTTKQNMEEWLDGEPVSRYLEVKSMTGDPSDSIPGIRGIGLKTAIKSLKHFEDFDSLPSNDLSGRLSVLNENECIEILHRNYALMRLPTTAHQVDIDNPKHLETYIQERMHNHNLCFEDFEAWVTKSGMKSIQKKIDEWRELYGDV